MSLRDDPSYFPQPNVPNDGNYGSSFGREMLYYDYLPKSAAIEAANAAAGEKTYSSGKYTFNPATGQYTWVPAGTVASNLGGNAGTGVNAGSDRGGNDGLSSSPPGGGYGIPGATMSGGISGPTTGLASIANSLAATLGNMNGGKGISGAISDTLAKNIDPSFSHEGRTGRGTGSTTITTPEGKNVTVDKSSLGSFTIGPDGLTSLGGVNVGTGLQGQGLEGQTGLYGDAAAGMDGFTGADSNGGFGPATSGGMAEGGYIGSYAHGGLGSLGGYSDGGRLLRGPGDGVSDSIPATIGRAKQPARLADGEFVVPSRIVSELGNGSTEAGARKLYAMLARIQAGRKKSIGTNKVAVNSRMDKHLPA